MKIKRKSKHLIKKKTVMLFIVLFLFACNYLFAQDTAYFNPRTYIELKQKVYAKNKEESILELIKFSEDSFKSEKCYYINEKRLRTGKAEIYKLITDTIILNNAEKWDYKKINDTLFSITLKTKDFVTEGYAKCIVPFVKEGEFITCNSDNELVITETYKNNELLNWKIPKYEIEEDSICVYTKDMAKFPGGELQMRRVLSKNFFYPKLPRKYSGISGAVYVKFVVDKKGWVKNPQIEKGLCPEIDKICLRAVSLLHRFFPGNQNGKPVNVWVSVGIPIGE